MITKIRSFYYFLKGSNLYSSGLYEEALSAFQQAYKLNSSHNICRYYQKTLEKLNKVQQYSSEHKQLFEQIEDIQARFKAMQQQILIMEHNNYKPKNALENRKKAKKLEKVMKELEERLTTLEQSAPSTPNHIETSNKQYSQQFTEIQNQVTLLEEKIEENGLKDQEDRDKLQKSSIKIKGLEVQMNDLENNTSVQVMQLQDRLDEHNEKATQDRNQLEKNTEQLKNHSSVLRDSGTISKAEINNLAYYLKSEEPLLYIYYKTFYWTIFNFFHAHLVLSTDLLTYNTDYTITKEESYTNNTKATLNNINIVTKHLPVVGSLSEIITEIINTIYHHNQTKGFKDKTTTITNIVKASFHSLEELEVALVRASYFITNIRKEAILDLTYNVKNTEVKINKGLASKFKYLKKLIASDLDHDTKSENNQIIKFALQDTVLLIVELYKHHNQSAFNCNLNFNQQVKLIFESNHCEESIKTIANHPLLSNDTCIFKIIGDSISFMESIEQC